MTTHEELRAREQLLDRLAEAVPVGLFQIDSDGRVVYANDRLREIFGTDLADTIAAQLTSVVPADRQALDAAIEGVLEHGTPVDIEVALRMPDSKVPGYCTI